MEDSRIRNLLDKFEKFKEKNKGNFDDQFGNVLLNDLNNLFIIPELDRRKKDGSVKGDYFPNEILIKNNLTEKPVVEFDGEIKQEAIVIAARNFDIKGEDVHLWDIRGISGAKLENLENVAQFFYIKKIGDKYHIISNLGKTSTSMKFNIDGDSNITLEELLGALHHMSFVEKILRAQDIFYNELEKAGLWAAPAIIPYPLNKIIDAVRKGSSQEGRDILVEHCSNDFVDKLCYRWWAVTIFAERKPLLVDAINAHKNGQYRLSIHTLLPQIEGIVTDWIYQNGDRNKHAYRQESKTKEFFDSIEQKLDDKSLGIIIQSTAKFILEGPVLESFKGWESKINTFANRHVVEHGKFDDTLFTEENSIKLILLLDTLFYILRESEKLAR